jgi:hypothetical protein
VELHIDGLQLHFTSQNTKPEWMNREIDYVQLQPDIYLGICIYVKDEEEQEQQPIIITVRGGLAYLYDDTNPQGVPISIRDYDITGYITDEECAQLPVDAKGFPYEERGNV